MSGQVGSGKLGDWDRKQTQQYSQEQAGYLDLPYMCRKKTQKSVVKKQQNQAKVVKVWHEGAD